MTIKNLKIANNSINFYVEQNIASNAKYFKRKNVYILSKFFFEQSEEVIFRSISLLLKKISGRYYSPRGKSITDSISKISAKNFNKFTIGGCYIDKVNETIFISREN